MFELMSGVNVVKQEWSELIFTQTSTVPLYDLRSLAVQCFACFPSTVSDRIISGQLKTILKCYMTGLYRFY